MSGVLYISVFGACLTSCLCAACSVNVLQHRRVRVRLRTAADHRLVEDERPSMRDDLHIKALRYCEQMSRDIALRQTLVFSRSLPSVLSLGSNRFYAAHARTAGCEKSISAEGFLEGRLRLAVMGLVGGALLGSVLSNELGVVLGICGGLCGWMLPKQGMQAVERERALDAEQHLSEMLEVVALGLRSGLTFDRSFSLYGTHFDSTLAQTCMLVQQRWSLGLQTRDEALRDMASSYDCEQLAQVVESIVRSLRFGTSLSDKLEETAAQVRAAYRTTVAERVAKAPVKMMLPTGTLILPAMLLLVLGPILIELVQGF